MYRVTFAVQHLIYILPQFLQCCVQYVISDRVITALGCRWLDKPLTKLPARNIYFIWYFCDNVILSFNIYSIEPDAKQQKYHCAFGHCGRGACRPVAITGVTILPHGLIIKSLKIIWRWHDDVINWKDFPRYWPFVRGIHRSTVNSPHNGQWRGALMFSFICVWINSWVNNCEAGDLRRHRAQKNELPWPSRKWQRNFGEAKIQNGRQRPYWKWNLKINGHGNPV